MENKYYIFALLLVLTLNLSSEAVFAQNAAITVTIEPHELHVGDQVCIHTTIENTGDVDFSNILVDIPLPEGLQFQYLYGRNRNGGAINNVNWFGDTWSAGNMRVNSNGQQKNLYIYAKVLPELEGQTITATARYLQLVYYNGTTYVDISESIPAAAPDTAKIISSHDSEPDNNKNNTDNRTGNDANNGADNRTGNGNESVNNLGNTKLTSALDNLTQSKKDNPLANLQTGGGKNGKSYEVSNTTNQNQPDNPDAVYVFLGILIIIALILAGYFKGMKN